MTQLQSNKDTLEDNTKFKDGVNRNARLMVRNISFKATEDALKEHFSKYGTVEEATLLKKPDGRLVGCGFVHFAQVPMANKAIAATNKKPFLDRPINVTWAIPKHKYVEQLQSNNVTTKTENSSSEDNQPAVKKENETNQDKKARINRNARLIIRNVSFKATEESLQEHFKSYGDILEVKLLKKPDGKLVGCAFVHFKNVPMAKKALLNTNMKPFLGRPISVDWAVAKNKYMQHIVNQQTEMQDKIKKEDPNSDDEDAPINTTIALKDEIKSESEDESEEEGSGSESGDEKSESDNDSDEEKVGSDDEKDDSEASDDEDEDMEEQESQADPQERKRIQLNDAEDGCTVFVMNIPFSVDNDQLREFAANTGPVKYALICMDRMTEHSKGSGFVKFENKEDAEKFLTLPADQLKLDGQAMLAKPALKRENLQKDKKKEAKDNRNLYLVKEGVIVAGTKAAEGVTASDMSKRLTLERSKTQMLKNLNRFVSRYRLVVANLPQWCDDGKLRRVCVDASGRNALVTEARVMRDLRAPITSNGKHPSKSYGFVAFTRHEDALACLRKLNNNPDIFDKNNRPIVSFSIEDRTALNARKKRLEKSIANNPLANNSQTPEYNAENAGNASYQNRKRKSQQAPDESYVKKGRFNKDFNKNNSRFNNDSNKNTGRYNNDANKNTGRFNNDANKNNGRFNNDANKNNGRFNKDARYNNGRFNRNNQPNEVGKFVKRQNDEEQEFTGLTAKEGALHKMRNSHKLRAQEQIHRETVKRDKKLTKRALRLKRAAKERVKQPKQKVNKNVAVQSRRNKKKFNKANAE